MVMRGSKFSFLLAAILIVVFMLSGCARRSEFIIAQSRVIEATRTDNLVAEVTSTPRYVKMVSQIKSVAINAPSSCANQLASSATGSAESKGAIVMTSCGVEMAEIERALARHGFTVYSWKMVNNAIIANTNKTKNTAAVAKELGAEVLFQVNSLERINVSPGRDARIERSFFASNAYAETLSPLKLDEQRINEIKIVTGKIENKRLPLVKGLGAMLDINAVDTETGQTIWFYRWSKHEDISKNVFAKFFLQCWDGWGCLEEVEQTQESQKNTSEKRSTEVETISTSARPANEQDVIYFGLLRDVTADFVKRFSSGQ